MAILTSKGVKAPHQLKGVRKVRISRDRRGAGSEEKSDIEELQSQVADIEDKLDTLEDDVYSTEETLTNKVWIDGKPIYRKVFEVASLPNNTQTNYSHGIVNADSFVTVRGIAKSTTLALPIPFVERNGTTNIQIWIQSAAFYISTNYDSSSYAGTIILEYTNTTD